MFGEQHQRVEHVLAVDLHDLQLREQQFGERQCRRRIGEPIREVEAVAHLERVDEHVDRPLARRVHEVRLLAPEQRVVLAVRGVALGLEQLVERGAVLAARGEVDVDLDATRSVRPLGGVGPDRHAAHQPDEEPALVGGRHDPEGLGERVLQCSRRDAGLIGHRAVPL